MQIEVYRMTADGDTLTISLEAVCDSFSSLLWDIEYYQCGSFEVYIAANPEKSFDFSDRAHYRQR